MYKYAINGSHRATVYRTADDGELVAEARIDSFSDDIKSIAKATVAALNGEASASALCDAASELGRKVNVHLNAEAVRDLASGGQLRVNEDVTISGASDIASVAHPVVINALCAARDYPDGLARTQLALCNLAREALALVDQAPPAEKVIGWAALRSGAELFGPVYASLEDCRVANPTKKIVHLVEEPSP